MADKRIAILKHANKLFRQGKADAAIKEYKKILDLKADDLEVRRIVGDLELRQNNNKGAIEQFEWIADYYLKEGFFAKAIAMLKRITRVDPNYEQALCKLADLYTKQGLVMEAKQIYLDIAEECKRKNNQKKALDMYKKILEFDRSNIKMRLLLADNYMKEGLKNDALNEYLVTTDIILSKKDFSRAEELLLATLGKFKDIKIIEKLFQLYIKENQDDKAIGLINEYGLDAFRNADMLKVLGELYLKKNLMPEAEKIFSRVAELNPEEKEVIIRLGKVYIQREEYDKTYNLFLPIIEKNLKDKKFEDAANLLRFIIASKNSYVPALVKLAEIFKVSGKTNNLIALYESMIPIYEENRMKEELKDLLQELIQLSDTPFSYEEQLAKLTGQEAKDAEEEQEEKESEREREFITYNLRAADEAMRVSDVKKAVEILKKTKGTFPKNAGIRKKLFEVYLEGGLNEQAVEEGKGLLELYKFLNLDDEYTELLDKLSVLRPDDDKLVALSGEEKTSIDIDFGAADLAEQIHEMGTDIHEEEEGEGELGEDILVLSEAENVAAAPPLEEDEGTKSLSSVLSEVDFYVNDGYFGDAEKLIEQLKQKYPGNKLLLAKIDKFDKAKLEARQKDESSAAGIGLDFEIEQGEEKAIQPKTGAKPVQKPVERERTEQIPIESPMSYDLGEPELIYQGTDSNIEINLEGEEMQSPSSSGIKFGDLDMAGSDVLEPLPMDMGMELDAEPDMERPERPERPEPEWPGPGKMERGPALELDEEFGPEPEPVVESSGDIFELAPSMSADRIIPPTMPEIPPQPKVPGEKFPGPRPGKPAPEPEPFGSDIFEIESDIAEESSMAQEYEDSKFAQKVDAGQLKKSPAIIPKPEEAEIEDGEFEIEVEEPEDVGDMGLMEIDKDLLIQSPSVSPLAKQKIPADRSSSSIDEIDFDNIMIDKEEDSAYDVEAPFKEMSSSEMAFEGEEDLLEDEAPFIEEAFLETEKNVRGEIEVIQYWLKELEKQRTSTIEKNMMEIFEEFKKGVDEKIGQEDYDTRYNLGIAYKEMGLLEEAIHEFLISSKHPLKYFDSTGLLGMCFREKGMFGEAISWFEKALNSPGREQEEYLAIKYELVLTLRLREDFKKALKIIVEILKTDPNYRDARALYQELRGLLGI